MELLDVYTVNREKTGRTIPRGCDIAEGERLLVVHVCVMNDRQEMLIQRRRITKERYPGCWDLSAGGFVQSGETSPEAALREMREEVGLSVSSDALQFLFTEPFSSVLDDFYLVHSNIPLSALTMQPEEVSELSWAARAEIETMLTDGRFVDYPLSCIRRTFDLAYKLL